MHDTLTRGQGPRFEKIRHQPNVRKLRVRDVKAVTPAMRRVTLEGEDLHDFPSLGFDDHVKLVLPDTLERRDYTPRRFCREACTLTIDFALHEAGPATRWALAARTGDPIQVAGPKGSSVTWDSVRRRLLVGDETALPAIGRCIEEAQAGVEITSLVAVAGPQEHQTFATHANLTTLWAHRPLSTAADPTALLALVDSLALTRDTFVWVAAEAKVARAVRAHLVAERDHPPSWIKAGGYWIQGRADAHERTG